MDPIFFSIIVVALNPGQKLMDTLTSIQKQTYRNYEIILKDGFSTDGSFEAAQNNLSIGEHTVQIVQKKDSGIYDAMNQAIQYVRGKYILFLNCGDLFFDESVLERMERFISEKTQNQSNENVLFYGNQYLSLQEATVYSTPVINEFACFRNVPCHQVCFYNKSLFAERCYDTHYRVRADYEHFLYCYFVKKTNMYYAPILIANYEGGGFSETKVNKEISRKEHREVTKRYMGKAKTFWFRLLLILTLAPLRTKIAENPALAKKYNTLKKMLYKIKGRTA